MPEVQYIKNVTVHKAFNLEEGTVSKQLTGMPDHNPDECIITGYTWYGESDDNNLYLIWCNLTNDIIGSFCGGNISPHFPQTRIWLTGPVPNHLEFKLYRHTLSGSDLVASNQTKGNLAITMEFVKYKRTRDHA